jgi:hypothetical protein
MWFSTKSQSRQFSRSSERRRADGSRRHRLAFRPALAALEDRRLLSTLTVRNNNDSESGLAAGRHRRRPGRRHDPFRPQAL